MHAIIPYNIMNTKLIRLSMLVFAALLLLSTDVHAQKKKKKRKSDPVKKEKKDEIKPLKYITKKCNEYDGLFRLYQDTASGEMYIMVTSSQLNQEFLHFSQVADGVVDAGYFRGAYGRSRLFEFERYFNQLHLRLKNTNYEFDQDSELAKAAKANINEPVLISEKIIAANKTMDTVIVSATSLFKDEGIKQIKFPPPPGVKKERWFTIGEINKDRTKVLSIKNYPKNTNVRTEYVFVKKYPSNYGSEAVSDARSVSVKYDHSLIELPEVPMEPRIEDPRVGYFTSRVSNMTTTETINWRDRIHRWRLEKKDPSAEISEPVTPITWWIENTTPKELRGSIRKGVEAWNKAFEKAGFRNAVVVKEQPDDADWDAGDIRYNVLRWTSSPRPPFGGYGPSFVDPRTGEILGADIMLEFVFVTNRLREHELFETASFGWVARQEDESVHHGHECLFAEDLQNNLLFGMEVIDGLGLSEVEKEEFLDHALRELCLHEVGHTLGLNHNMKASSIYSLEQLKDKALMAAQGPTGSVMDYAPSNLPFSEEDHVQYFHVVPGPYDNWAIEFGYSQVANDTELKSILDKSTDPLLVFGNDADDMRSVGRGVDPRVMIYDMSSDPVAHGINTIELSDRLLDGLMEKYGTGNRSHQELLRAYYVLTGRHIGALNVMTRQIGGVYVDRSFADQESENNPYTPVPEATQKAAMDALIKYGLSPNAFDEWKDLLDHLQMQRRGFSHWGRNEDPHFHDRVRFAHMFTLLHLLNSNTHQRLIDSELYGNTYTLSEMFTDLTNGIFQADRNGKVNYERQGLQSMYVDKLIGIMSGEGSYRPQSVSMAHHELSRIRRWMNVPGPDTMTRAHRAHQTMKIKNAMEGR